MTKKEEMQKKRNQELNRIRVKRFRAKHDIKCFKVDLESQLADEIITYLKTIGVTQKDFVVESYKRLRQKGDF